MRPSSFAAVRRERQPSLIQTPSDINGPARPGEITYCGLFVHEYGCMAALGNGAAIGKCVIKSKEIQGNPRRS
jgi:hypothetical protein